MIAEVRRALVVGLLLGCVAIAWPVAADAPARGTPAELRDYSTELLANGIRDIGPLEQCAAADPVAARQMGQRVRTLMVTIGRDGHVGDVRTLPARLVSPAVRMCFLGIARAWRLTPPRGGRKSIRLVFTRALIAGVVNAP